LLKNDWLNIKMTVKKDVQEIINISIKIIKSNPYSKARKLIRSIEVNGRKIPVNLANNIHDEYSKFHINNDNYEKYSNNESKYRLKKNKINKF
jgi:hypothetical protein